MSCCGELRAQLQSPRASNAGPGSSVNYRGSLPHVFFQYSGNTGLTVRGPMSGKCYRFNGSGAIVEVDPRDQPSLVNIPRLKQV